jgi:CHAD domain-containing protein
MTRSVLVSPVDLGLPATPLEAGAGAAPAAYVRARLDEQVRALLEYEAVAREGADPEGVHQMRVAVRRIRAALKASDEPQLDEVHDELRWLGGVLGRIRDLDVLLGHLRAQAADLSEDERAAAERLLSGLVEERRRARRRMLDTFRGARYGALLRRLAALVTAEHGEINGRTVGKKKTAMLDVVVKPHRKLAKATKEFQDILGDHQDTVVAEAEVRRLLDEQAEPDVDVVFVAGRLVEREQARRADRKARWRASFEEVDRLAGELR